MKKVLICIFVVVLVISSTGCKPKQKISEKIADSIVEKIIESNTDGNVDIEKDKITVTDEEGNVSVFGETEWPTSDLAKRIPEIKTGTITTVMDSGDTILIGLIEVSKDDYEDYLKEVKKTFTKDTFDMNAEGNITFGAQNGDGISIMLMYTKDNSLSITAGDR